MGTFLSFIVFSTIEVLAALSLMLALFRLNMAHYFWQALILSFFMGIQSYFFRVDLELDYVATLVNLLFYFLFLNTIVRIPFIWSAIISFTGFFIYGALQALLYLEFSGQALQLVSGIATFIIAYVLFKFGVGFAGEFSTLKIKGEFYFVLALIFLSYIFLGITMLNREIWVNFAFFTLGASVFLRFAIKKEKEQ